MQKLAGLTPFDHVVDLGCGDARVLARLCATAKCRGTGCDIDNSVVKLAQSIIKRNRLDHLVDIFECDITTLPVIESATLLVLFQTPSVLAVLANRLRCWPARMRVISYHFPFEALGEPSATVPTVNFLSPNNLSLQSCLYVYNRGHWQSPTGSLGR